MTEIVPDSSRRTRRDTTRRGPAGSVIPQLPPGVARRPFPPTRVVSDDQVETIHRASLQILSEIGMDFLLPEARDLLKTSGGVKIDGERVRFEPAFVEEMVSHAPSSFTFNARNPAKSIPIGGDHIAFVAVGSPPNCHDMDNGRRPGTRADYRKFLKLTQYFNCIDASSGYSVEPIDLHPSIRHLEALRDKAILIDKPMKCYSLGRQNVLDAIEIARISANVSEEELLTRPSLMTIVNTNSPLKLDNNMLMGMMELSSRGQVVCVTPFTLAGAMAPVTIAGAVALQNAEALAGLAFCQLVKKGAPVVYGGFTSNVDMKSGAPAFGTPEYMKSTLLGGQMARRYGLPYRTSNTCAANTVDAQAAYESVFSLWGVTMGGGNYIMHGAGWMEGGLVASFEKFVIDCDLIQMVKSFLQPIDTSEPSLALDAIREVGPGGHFFGAQHTLERYSTAFYQPIISDWRNYQQWQAAGSPDAYRKANQVYKQALEAYVEPAMPDDVRGRLDEFVDRRVREGGVKTDF